MSILGLKQLDGHVDLRALYRRNAEGARERFTDLLPDPYLDLGGETYDGYRPRFTVEARYAIEPEARSIVGSGEVAANTRGDIMIFYTTGELFLPNTLS